PEYVRRRARDRGIITTEEMARLSDSDALNLIFRPGFSTSEALTLVSGRGVGMDVIKSGVESIGGSVAIHSRPGLGTTLVMTIPLTLTIVKALLFEAGGERFAVPQTNLVEILRLPREFSERGVELLHAVPVHRYRGRLLPLVDLTRVLDLVPCTG